MSGRESTLSRMQIVTIVPLTPIRGTDGWCWKKKRQVIYIFCGGGGGRVEKGSWKKKSSFEIIKERIKNCT